MKSEWGTNETVSDFGAMLEVMQFSNGSLQNCLSNILLLSLFIIIFLKHKSRYCFYSISRPLWHPVQMCWFLRQWTRHSRQLSTLHPSTACLHWLMPNARSLSLSLLCKSQTNINCKPLHTHTHRVQYSTQGEIFAASLVWLCSPRGTYCREREMDRQELSARTQGHTGVVSLQIMNHMWSVNSAPIRSDDNYLSCSHSSWSGWELPVGGQTGF